MKDHCKSSEGEGNCGNRSPQMAKLNVVIIINKEKS